MRRILAVDIAYFCGGIGFIVINIIYLKRIGRSKGGYKAALLCAAAAGEKRRRKAARPVLDMENQG